jgi:hypothetical protein
MAQTAMTSRQALAKRNNPLAAGARDLSGDLVGASIRSFQAVILTGHYRAGDQQPNRHKKESLF